MNDTLGARISSLRRQSGMTQAALAKTLGLSRVTITFWETNRNTPPSHELVRIATALDVPVDVFLHGMISLELQQTVTVDEAALLSLYRSCSVIERIGLLRLAGRLKGTGAEAPKAISNRGRSRNRSRNTAV